MNRLDDLISVIRDSEAVDIDDALDKDCRKRIENMVFKGMEETTVILKRKKSKRWLVLTVAATLIMALGLTAYAAKENEWDIALINFMGISDANTLQLENGVVEIQQGQKSRCIDYSSAESGEAREIEMLATTSIGDKNEVYVLIETDYVLPADFNVETDYVLPKDYRLSVEPNKGGYGSVFTYFAEDNRLGFLLAISNCRDINKAEISLRMENLYLYHDLQEDDTDREKELLCEGTWELKWSYNYRSNTKTERMLHPFEADGVTYYLTKVEVSPISIRLEAFRMPQDRDKDHEDVWLEEIHFSDGTVLRIDNPSGGGIENGMFAEEYTGVESFGDAINPKEIAALVIRGEKVYLH